MGFSMFFIGLHPWFIPQVPICPPPGARDPFGPSGRRCACPISAGEPPMFWILWLVIVKPPCVHIQGVKRTVNPPVGWCLTTIFGSKTNMFLLLLGAPLHPTRKLGTDSALVPRLSSQPSFRASATVLRLRCHMMSPFRSRAKCGLHGMKKGINQKK
jgi:hypothetical protein